MPGSWVRVPPLLFRTRIIQHLGGSSESPFCFGDAFADWNAVLDGVGSDRSSRLRTGARYLPIFFFRSVSILSSSRWLGPLGGAVCREVDGDVEVVSLRSITGGTSQSSPHA